MAQKFTDLLLRNVTSGGAPRLELWDQRLPGFGLRVSDAGTKTFILVYRHRGRPRRLSLGRYPFLSLADAREKAEAALAAVGKGLDPALLKDAASNQDLQFEAVVATFVDRHCGVHNKASTAKETARLLHKHFVAAWGRRDIRDIQQAHVRDVLDDLIKTGRPSEANHALGVIKTLFAWCMDRELLASSPCDKLKKPARHDSRARVLTTAELVKVWQAFEADGYPFGCMGKLLLLTGQRRGEVTQMTWATVDLAAQTWTIPAELAKNGRAHVVPLTATAIAALASIPRTGPLVFPARGNGANVISGFTRAKLRFDWVAGVDNWTLHDLRRTVATGMAQLGIAPHVIERILNHVSGTFGGVAGVYNRFQYVPEMRAALTEWENHLRDAVSKAAMPGAAAATRLAKSPDVL